jgi:tRNA threonylcarbamoyladenosine biosynthesis protein TsaE
MALRKSAVQEETIIVPSESAESTFHLGEILGGAATGGEVIGLTGPLGVGKTVFVKGLAKGLGVTDSYVSSPTFILVHPHEGRLPLYHIDLYRLEKESDAEAIGLEEYLEGEGVAAIEWIDKGLAFLPANRLLISLYYKEGDQREIVLTASGIHYMQWIEQVKKNILWKEVPRNGP